MDSSSTVITAILREAAARALDERGISLELISSLGWRSSIRSTNGEEWIEIPYYNLAGDEVNTKYRTVTGEKKFSQSPGGQKCFYNMAAIPAWQGGSDNLIICEGEMDAVIAMQCGYLAVSVPDGGPSKPIEGETVKYDYLEELPKTGAVILCTDADEAGANLLHDIALRLGKQRCMWIKYPIGCKDLNEVFKRYGERGVHKTIQTAQFMKVDGVYKMRDLPPVSPPESRTLSFMPITIRKRDFSIVTGIPSHGKSTFINFLCDDLAKQGWRIGYASFEQEPQTDHNDNLRLLTDIHNQANADKLIDQRYRFIVPDVDSDEELNLGWLMEKMSMAVFQHNVDVFVIDPWNEMDHDAGRDLTATQYTGMAIKLLKKLGKRYNVHVMVIAHPTKQKKSDSGLYAMPSLYDIADSAHWYNKPELGIVVYLNEQGNTTIRIAKSRHHKKIGKPDDIDFSFNEATQRFTKISSSYSYGD
jgi:twinkle protein